MDERYLPTTREGKLDRLVEECAEVIQAVQKLKRFGPGPNTVDGVEHPDNIEHLLEEMKDLDHALSQVRCIDLGKVRTGVLRYGISRIVPEREERLAHFDQVVYAHFCAAYAELRKECPRGDLHMRLFIDEVKDGSAT